MSDASVSLADQIAALRGHLANAQIEVSGLTAVAARGSAMLAARAERDALAAAIQSLERLRLYESIGADLSSIEIEATQ